MDPPSRPNQPSSESLTYEDLRNVHDCIFNAFKKFPTSQSSHLRTSGHCALQAWSSSNNRLGQERQMTKWNPNIDSGIYRDLPIFQDRIIDHIVDHISSASVTVVVAPTGTGKTLMGPMLNARLLMRSGPYERDGKVSSRGLSICPSSENAQNMAKWCEKIFMESRHSEIVNFLNPFERVECSLDKEFLEKISKVRPYLPEFGITNYRGGLMALAGRDFFLKTVIIDEAHSTKPEILVLLSLARKLLDSKRLEKLVLTSATLDCEEIAELRRYFEEGGHKLADVNLINHMETVKSLQMSCPRLSEEGEGQFAPSSFSKMLSEDFERVGNVRWPMVPLKQRVGESWTVSWCLLYRPRPFGYEEDHSVPEMNNLMPYVMHALHRAMEVTSEMLEEKVLGDKMPSILVILPGKEHVERMRSSVQNVIEPTPNSHLYELHTGLFKSVMYRETGKPAFVLERLKPTAGKALAAKDKIETEEAKSKREKKELELIGPWKGKKGKIILATPHAAEGMTLEDIVFIIDAGVLRIPAAYSTCGLRSQILQWIDKRLLYQRAGRGGRTIDTEYFLSVSGDKVKGILSGNLKPKLLLRYFDEMAWYRSIRFEVSGELIWTPPTDLTDAFRRSFMIRGLWRSGFTDEVNLLYDYFSFLAPEKARMVMMGVRLGLAAHVITYVAESIVHHKLCGRPTKIAENYEAIGDSDVYGTFVNVSAHLTWKEEQIRAYDMGDSVARADLLTTWLRHAIPCDTLETEPDYHKYETCNDVNWEEMENRAAGMADGIFWSGRWCTGKDEKMKKKMKGGPGKDEFIGMKKLQNVLIREDGREAVCVQIHQITRACQRLGLIEPKDILNQDEGRGSLFSPRYNRYVRGEDNYNLTEDGRALFRAILTMNSDKLARACERTYVDKNGNKHVSWDRFEIYADDNTTKVPDAFIFPERRDWKERDNKGTSKFVRFWEGFKATHSETFNGCLDPLTTSQAAFFLNVYGMTYIENNEILIYLNASPEGYQDGLPIHVDHFVADRVWEVRESLKTMTKNILIKEDVKALCTSAAQAIIDLWKGLDSDVERNIKIMAKWERQVQLLDLIHGRVAGDLQYNEGLNIPPPLVVTGNI